ncbi:NAD(P)/FAD-dependent oxidoreductase [Ferirhizobium litorale]|uniref:FAD-binding oxidoreductase n=1 Tax=Ferirhizobium litorale TaxID=2927786 RepID=A0AAE3QJ77_9HYPH|nr:FAD-binding oxidoreductase [Fererhizobium litorale]MDI7924411.1 FAD-binding oxidoreductase [Fererhizobium litorale]
MTAGHDRSEIATCSGLAADTAPAGAIHSLWLDTACQAPITQRMEGSLEVDVAIVGGGYTGLSSALHLAENGLKVAVLEAREIGYGASGRNGGQVNPGFKLDPHEVAGRYGVEAGERALRFVHSAPDRVFELVSRYSMECAPIRPGSLTPAHSEAALRMLERRAEGWATRGVRVRMLDQGETEREIGTSRYLGALLDPRGGSLQPLSYVRELARIAIEKGARVFEGAAVRSLRKRASAWVATTAHGEVRARRVIVATNGYTGRLLPGLRQTIIAANSFQLATAPLDPSLASTILRGGRTASDTRRIVRYFRKDPENRLVIGGRGHFGEPTRARDFSHLQGALRELFPQLAGVPIECHWAGRVALTQDGVPHIHEPEEGLLVVLGYNGRGIAMGTAMGQAIAEYVGGNAGALPFPVTPVRRIPMHVFQRLYLAAAVNWFMFRDSL